MLDANVLSWSTGAARGELACATVDQMPTIIRRPKSNAWRPDESFTQAVELVAVSCDSQALSSVGLYGIVVDSRTEGQTSVHSSDNVTISSCVMASEISEAPEIVILPPDAVPLICKVIELDDTSLFYSNGDMGLLVKQVPPLKQDVDSALEVIREAEMAVELSRERVTAFIKRADALAESKRSVYVTLGASKGQLSLAFMEGTTASDDSYLSDRRSECACPYEIKHDGTKLARAIAHVKEIVLDHIERRIIVLRGDDPGSFT